MVKVIHQGERLTFNYWGFDVWEWALSLIEDPYYVRAMRWDAMRLHRHNGRGFERFINEPWTADAWWELQVS
jgi:hypothetical protein